MKNFHGIRTALLSLFFVGLAIFGFSHDAVADIVLDSSGWNPSTVGDWDSGTMTATLTQDVTETIRITSDGITLEGNGHTVQGTGSSTGVDISNVAATTGIVVRNLTIDSFSTGINVYNTDNVLLEKNTASNCLYGVWVERSSSVTISKNTITLGKQNGYGISFSSYSDNNTVTGNSITNNDKGIYIIGSDYIEVFENSFESNVRYGLEMMAADNNRIYNNNFIDNNAANPADAQAVQWSGSGDVFSLPGAGGNYWSNYAARYPSGTDADNDGFFDTPYDIDGGAANRDDLPLVAPVDISGDENAPEVTITAPADGAVTNAASVTLTAEISDESETAVESVPAGISATLPAPGGTVSGTVPLDNEGDNLLVVTARDAAGNVGSNSIIVTRDTTPPTLSVNTPGSGSILGESPVTLSIAVDDATAVTVTFGGNTVTLTEGSGNVTGDVDLVEGSNDITITAVDAAGNTATIVHTLVLDLSAPVVTIDDPSNNDAFGPGEETIPVTATVDDLSGTLVASSPAGVSGSLPPGGGPATGAVPLAEGANAITVTATDEFSRQGSASITVILDTTPPDLSVVSPEDQDTVSGTVPFEAQAEDILPGTGIDRVELSVDGALAATITEAPYTVDYDTTVLNDGPHTFEAAAYDGKGNSAAASAAVTADNTGPQITFVKPLDQAVVTGVMDIEILASDGISGLASIEVLAGGDAPTTDPSQSFDPPVSSATVLGAEDTTGLPDGPLTLRATAVDAEGNESVAEVTVMVDTAPELSITSPLDGSKVSGVLPIVVESPNPDIVSIEVSVDGTSAGTSPSSPFTADFDTTTRLDGEMVITAVATDLYGLTTSVSATVTVDNISVRLIPRSLTLFRGRLLWFCRMPQFAKLEGVNVGLLIPYSDHEIELIVPGGSPVPAVCAWSGAADCDHDGVPEWMVAFDRRALANSVRAGIKAGEIPEPHRRKPARIKISLAADGHVIGTVRFKVRDPFNR